MTPSQADDVLALLVSLFPGITSGQYAWADAEVRLLNADVRRLELEPEQARRVIEQLRRSNDGKTIGYGKVYGALKDVVTEGRREERIRTQFEDADRPTGLHASRTPEVRKAWDDWVAERRKARGDRPLSEVIAQIGGTKDA